MEHKVKVIYSPAPVGVGSSGVSISDHLKHSTGSAFLQRLFPLVFGNTHRYPCTLMRILYA